MFLYDIFFHFFRKEACFGKTCSAGKCFISEILKRYLSFFRSHVSFVEFVSVAIDKLGKLSSPLAWVGVPEESHILKSFLSASNSCQVISKQFIKLLLILRISIIFWIGSCRVPSSFLTADLCNFSRFNDLGMSERPFRPTFNFL